MSIEVQRVYDRGPVKSGKRILVDRLWPRGIRKEDLQLDLWLKDVGPSTSLRKWFGHDPDRWTEFRRRYKAELQQPAQRAQIEQLIRLARRGKVTMLYGARDQQHNEAIVLREVVEKALKH